MIVQHNMTALNANRQLGITNSNLAKTTEKLSSGYRVNRAADDAAGLSISEKMRGQIRGLNQASTNAQDGISLIQTAEGAMNEIHSMIQRMRELTVQASNDTNYSEDRNAISLEVEQLKAEIQRVGEQTQFNKRYILNGEEGTDLFLQLSANADQGITFSIDSMLEIDGLDSIEISTGETDGATNSALLANADSALEYVSNARATLGALQNRLEHTIANDDNTAENLQSSESKIRDANLADEMVTYSSSAIIQQAGQSMLAQANQSTQGILSLLG